MAFPFLRSVAPRGRRGTPGTAGKPRRNTKEVGISVEHRTEITATALFALVSEALSVTSAPKWESADLPGVAESLQFLDAGAAEDGPTWAIGMTPADSCEATDDYIPVTAALAERLIRLHLQDWLLERGWQVQVTFLRGRAEWRLADCLSFADGGGDRLDADYPRGADELTVLCAAVAAVSGHSVRAKGRGPT